MTTNAAISWRSLRIATNDAQPSSQVRCPWIAGGRLLQTQLWPTPSWIASFTTPIASISPVKACENSARQSYPKTPKLDPKQNPTQTSTRPRISPKNGRLQIGMAAGFKSESVAGFIGTRIVVIVAVLWCFMKEMKSTRMGEPHPPRRGVI